MELIERDHFLATLREEFHRATSHEGHCIFITGEAGIGKTSLVREFLKTVEDESIQYSGACDSLFTPRPLAPLHDLAMQIDPAWFAQIKAISSRTELFSEFVHRLTSRLRPVIIVFEDIHWADEATLDFVKFFARRIQRTNCLFILTLRDDDISQQQSLRGVFADLIPGTFTRMFLTPLSEQAVRKMASEKGYDAKELYHISGGNPFYVTEILASYSTGIPENIKDSILSVYNRLGEDAKKVWQLLSIIPEGLEVSRLYKMEEYWHEAIGNCIAIRILYIKKDKVFFKHEIYRRTVEESLSPFKRIALHKNLLDLFLQSFEDAGEIERIVHHAKNANEHKWVLQYAPLAARQAAAVGAHIQASKLYLTAIEYADESDTGLLLQLFEEYSYECYLTNQIKDAIIYNGKVLDILRGQNNPERVANATRLLSRLWWINGDRRKAAFYATQAIEQVHDLPAGRIKAMVLSNMSQLKMLSDDSEESIGWGEQAIAMAKDIHDNETLSHALNNVGTVYMRHDDTRKKGLDLLNQSLEIALAHSLEEHAARAYTNLGSNAVEMKDYSFAKKILEEGGRYCEERNLESWSTYLSVYEARLYMELGLWNEAHELANCLLKKTGQAPIVRIGALVVVASINMRRGNGEILAFLNEAKELAFESQEQQRILPVLVAFLQYEWIYGCHFLGKKDLEFATNLVSHTGNKYENSEYAFWMARTRNEIVSLKKSFEGYDLSTKPKALRAAMQWSHLACPWEEALALFESTEDDKRKAIRIVQHLGAVAVSEKMTQDMRQAGIKKIPRGIRTSTRANPAGLTNRELDVLQLLKNGSQNKEIAEALFISPKTVDHHISSILFKLDVGSRSKAVTEATRLGI